MSDREIIRVDENIFKILDKVEEIDIRDLRQQKDDWTLVMSLTDQQVSFATLKHQNPSVVAGIIQRLEIKIAELEAIE